MKNTFIVGLFLLASTFAFANTVKTVSGAKAKDIATVLSESGISPYSSNEGSVTYHAWHLDCLFSRVEGKIANQVCYFFYNRVDDSVTLNGKEALNLMTALKKAGAVEAFNDDRSQFNLVLLNLDVVDNANGESSATFVDMLE